MLGEFRALRYFAQQTTELPAATGVVARSRDQGLTRWRETNVEDVCFMPLSRGQGLAGKGAADNQRAILTADGKQLAVG